MENGILFSKNSTLSGEELENVSDLQKLFYRFNEELNSLTAAIDKARKFSYSTLKVESFAEKIVSKYDSSVINVESTGVSTQKSIWLYAKDYIDLSTYEKDLTASSITLSHSNFLVLLDKIKDSVLDNMRSFVNDSLDAVNLAMDNKYSFYFREITVRKFNFDEEANSLVAQFEITIDIR